MPTYTQRNVFGEKHNPKLIIPPTSRIPCVVPGTILPSQIQYLLQSQLGTRFPVF